MSFFGKILGTAIDLVTLPVSVIRDVIPGGGGYVDGDRSCTGKNLEEVSEDLQGVRKSLDD